MLCMFVVVCLTWSLCSALTFLPPPINLDMSSENFRHVLHWDPGPLTPVGTQYQVLARVNRKKWKPLGKSMTTSLKLKLKLFQNYRLIVQATLDHMVSEKSEIYSFCPYTDTIISPALVSLSGCGNCLEVNLSLPDPDESSNLSVSSLHTMYGPEFRVKWKKPGGVEFNSKENNSFKISNLEKGVEYCVQVETHIRVNKNTKTSNWTCSFTSEPQHSTVSVFIGVAASLLVLVTLVVSSVLIGLYYSGFLGKLKAHLPPALQATLSTGYTLTPESTAPDHIHISSDTIATTDHTPMPPLEEGGEEEEEEESKDYLDRGAKLPPADTPGPHSAEESCWRSSTKTGEWVSKDDVSKGGLYHDEDEGEDPVTAEGDQESEKEEPVREESEGSFNVNLLSLTLSTLKETGEDGEDGEDGEEDEKDRDTDDCGSYLLDQRPPHMEPTAKNIETIETNTPTSCEEEEGEGECSDYIRHS
ncbi:cytokine receptor family member b1 [Cheilinus undulatus]|uniref:cytokine receptor family member b1 n=1 Tax=Cheilinus undulatus TaxID=241271 RepID=UPI001BD2B4A8|nr:cytokine receptor family member b1 [Cheilinus undulatus]